MKFSKAILAVAAGVALSSAALAQDQAAVSAEKTSGIKTLIPSLYGNVQMRHYTLRSMEDDKVTNDTPKVQARPNIGLTLFDDKVDTSLLWVFSKTADTNYIVKDALASITQVKAIEGKIGFIGPYAETYLERGGSYNESYVGLYGEGAYDVPTAIGNVSFAGWGQWNAVLNSQRTSDNSKVEPENKTGNDTFALNEAGDTELNQRDPKLVAYQELSVKLKPSAVPNFSVGAAVEYDKEWTPKYDAKDVDGDTRVEQDGYTPVAMTTSKFILGYKLSDAVSVTNSLRHKTVGFYEEGQDASDAAAGTALSSSRWENRLILSATLF